LDQFLIKPIREPTPSISISEGSKENSKTSFEKESTEKSSDQSKSEHNRSEKSIKDTAQSIEKPNQQALSPKQAKVPTPLTKPTKPLVIDLEGEWKNFNKILSTEEQSTKPSTNPKQTTTEMVIERVVNTQETEHILVASSSKIVLKIEEIPPLNVFYRPQHKAVVRRQRNKRKLDVVLTPEDEPLDVLWKDPTTNPLENLTRLSQIASVYASVTIDKAAEVQLLLKEKEDRILFLEQQLQQVSINQQAETQLAKLQQDFQQM